VSALRREEEDGVASLVLPVLLWVVTLAAVALIDVTAYLVAASRAQSLADAAALAAVAADAERPGRSQPRARAETLVRAGDGRLERCACRLGTGRASTEVSVEVPGLVLPRLGAGRVLASADAVLTPPARPGGETPTPPARPGGETPTPPAGPGGDSPRESGVVGR
jgi:hypothetical protein